jgi:hypothetical protein
MKPPRFLVSSNRLAKTDDQFILHTRKPALLVRILIIGETDEVSPLTLKVPIPHSDRQSLELIRVWEEAPEEVILATLKRMAVWYHQTQTR